MGFALSAERRSDSLDQSRLGDPLDTATEYSVGVFDQSDAGMLGKDRCAITCRLQRGKGELPRPIAVTEMIRNQATHPLIDVAVHRFGQFFRFEPLIEYIKRVVVLCSDLPQRDQTGKIKPRVGGDVWKFFFP